MSRRKLKKRIIYELETLIKHKKAESKMILPFGLKNVVLLIDWIFFGLKAGFANAIDTYFYIFD